MFLRIPTVVLVALAVGCGGGSFDTADNTESSALRHDQCDEDGYGDDNGYDDETDRKEQEKKDRKEKDKKEKEKDKKAKKDERDKKNGKVTICHATGSYTNPYVEITISVNALGAHYRHQNNEDIIPAPPYGCPNGEVAEGEGEPEPKCEPYEYCAPCYGYGCVPCPHECAEPNGTQM